MAALVQLGYELYVPFGENTRTDLVVSTGSRLLRIQCKTGRLRNGAVRFATCSTYANHRNPNLAYRDYVGQIDAFAVFCPETCVGYMIPIDDVPLKRGGALRIDAPRNNRRRRVRFARDYEIGTVTARAAAT